MKIKQWFVECFLENKLEEKRLKKHEVAMGELQEYCIEAMECMGSKLAPYRQLFERYKIVLRPELVAHKKENGKTIYYWTLYYLWKDKYIIYSPGNYVMTRFKLAIADQEKQIATVTTNYQEIFDEFVVRQLKNGLDEMRMRGGAQVQKHIKTTSVPPKEEGHVLVNW